MKHQKLILLLGVLMVAHALLAQTSIPTYRITPVITPNTVIDGQSIRPCFQVDNLAINDSGEIAFSTYCRTGDLEITNMLFTSVASSRKTRISLTASTSGFSRPNIQSLSTTTAR